MGKRADNLVVDSSGITIFDWGLLAGIGISQELIKLFETQTNVDGEPRVAGFLYGYGLLHTECEEAIEGS